MAKVSLSQVRHLLSLCLCVCVCANVSCFWASLWTCAVCWLGEMTFDWSHVLSWQAVPPVTPFTFTVETRCRLSLPNNLSVAETLRQRRLMHVLLPVVTFSYRQLWFKSFHKQQKGKGGTLEAASGDQQDPSACDSLQISFCSASVCWEFIDELSLSGNLWEAALFEKKRKTCQNTVCVFGCYGYAALLLFPGKARRGTDLLAAEGRHSVFSVCECAGRLQNVCLTKCSSTRKAILCWEKMCLFECIFVMLPLH